MREYIEVSKPRIVIVLVITAVTSMLTATRFDSTATQAWDVNSHDLVFLILTGALASMGSSALNHYYDRDIDAAMYRTSNRPIPSRRLSAGRVLAYGIAL